MVLYGRQTLSKSAVLFLRRMESFQHRGLLLPNKLPSLLSFYKNRERMGVKKSSRPSRLSPLLTDPSCLSVSPILYIQKGLDSAEVEGK